ncbi:patatin-like phospholipase domain-containing protein 4 isoform X7 [Vulpes vulpes]|uniref:Patatin-like phospholipase domain-containing protein 4 isoform X7 n=1 Tax=Vulpes vulpes TaxID=9627 RepID=A0ABM4ZAL1_VULVU|nr:patatin-like phospholipase domain-containing protein 4 isoform X8 [Canis lupus dingo]XP_038305287.1 patatin-like phospholipase domain-containing protein 4 isoform X5 [Canis lupus familiaris]XP_038320854.1 patatin-like phospholipase domain-containing protein 4 isoform X5 [Canis lupus familiaris]XP_038442708.1 patatin-like phospholipase domain-containing protein 4 isoform X5 [Canis lupus familiaris]XP_048963618.1 patatin-like phospholipase domain-containing protein 4 isoform X8 [Canis lupus di
MLAQLLLMVPRALWCCDKYECNEFTYKFAEEIRRQSFGAVTPGYDFMARLRSGMELILPPNAHELAHNRLHVSITNTKTRENYLVSSFSSREDLIKVTQVLLASSFVPIYAGLKPVEYQGQKWVDGGLTNSLPILPVGRTVTISPFSGRLDISPQDKGQLDLYINITNQDIMLSVANLVRLNQALFPPSKRKMESLYQDGFDDAIKFLLKENWFE